MKNYMIKTDQIHRIFIMTAVLLCLSSCSEWLDVRPDTQLSESDQFSSEVGYKDALIGVYQSIAAESLYGKELSFGLVDVLGQNYTNTNSPGHVYFSASTYAYQDASAETKINSIWNNQYASIAQINYLLKDIDKNKALFTGNNYGIIKGEALALRAFLHFDLLRLFSAHAASNLDKEAIPYMKDFTVVPQASLTTANVIQACLDDLVSAEKLLVADNDLIDSENSADPFLAYRENRFNRYAVLSLLARIHLYAENKELAFDYAKQVIDDNKFDFLKLAQLNTDVADIDRTGTDEHVFAVYVSNLQALTEPVFKTGTVTTANSRLLVETSRKNELFTVTSDIRNYPVYWADSKGITYYAKLWQEDDNDERYRKRIPLIKLSELYLIAAETAPSVGEGVAYFNVLREARIDGLLSANTTSSVLTSEIAKEYRKEFICEGQLFFFYKRNRTSVVPGNIIGPMRDEHYTLPKPLQEIEFGK